ncbi:SDR family NAD(P)-dependent oxidoreductase [Raineyella antarctica]|nr:SDR family NAD(P)-dependent oxidoreductase [Raineyella antarctica]
MSAAAMTSPAPLDLPRLDGRTVVVTGGASGIGYFAAEHLAALGASVVIAARNPERAAAAIRSIGDLVPGADVRYQPLDLADLSSVRDAGRQLREGRVDALLANAGVIGYPAWPPTGLPALPATTADGFELHWGTNYLGHFALVATMLPALLESQGRVVLVGSLSHRNVREPADSLPEPATASDLQLYARSKLAVMSLGFTLARRLSAAGSGATSLVAHPGVAMDVLDPVRPGISRNQPTVRVPGLRAAASVVAQGKDGGARSLVTALASPRAANGDYWGPGGLFQLAGRPGVLRPAANALDPEAGERLVRVSEELTGVRLPI